MKLISLTLAAALAASTAAQACGCGKMSATDRIILDWHFKKYACENAVDSSGNKLRYLTVKETEKSCSQQDEIGRRLKAKNYCLVDGDWEKCT